MHKIVGISGLDAYGGKQGRKSIVGAIGYASSIRPCANKNLAKRGFVACDFQPTKLPTNKWSVTLNNNPFFFAAVRLEEIKEQ